jgi:hypothetical protein
MFRGDPKTAAVILLYDFSTPRPFLVNSRKGGFEMIRLSMLVIFGIISLRAYAAGGVYQCIPCPAGIDCPEGTMEEDIAEDMARQSHVDGVPVGFVMPSAIYRGAEFDGWLLCNGQDIPVDTKYDALRTLLGSTYGAGKTPDFQGYFLRGAGGNAAAIGVAQADSAPNITGSVYIDDPDKVSPVGVFYNTGDGSKKDSPANDGINYTRTGFDASRSSASYGRRDEVAPANYAVYYYIKY